MAYQLNTPWCSEAHNLWVYVLMQQHMAAEAGAHRNEDSVVLRLRTQFQLISGLHSPRLSYDEWQNQSSSNETPASLEMVTDRLGISFV